MNHFCGAPVRIVRMPSRKFRDRGNLSKLRSVTTRPAGWRRPLLVWLFDSLSALSSMVWLWLFPPQDKLSMCKYYGHAIDQASLGRYMVPRCRDCKCEIESVSDLRTRHERKRV